MTIINSVQFVFGAHALITGFILVNRPKRNDDILCNCELMEMYGVANRANKINDDAGYDFLLQT